MREYFPLYGERFETKALKRSHLETEILSFSCQRGCEESEKEVVREVVEAEVENRFTGYFLIPRARVNCFIGCSLFPRPSARTVSPRPSPSTLSDSRFRRFLPRLLAATAAKVAPRCTIACPRDNQKKTTFPCRLIILTYPRPVCFCGTKPKKRPWPLRSHSFEI